MRNDSKMNNKQALYGLLAAIAVVILFGRPLLGVSAYLTDMLPIPGSEILGFVVIFFGTFYITYKLTGRSKYK